MGGLFAGEFAVLAARPRMGKTALATQILCHVARAGHLVLCASLEMGAIIAQLAERGQCDPKTARRALVAIRKAGFRLRHTIEPRGRKRWQVKL